MPPSGLRQTQVDRARPRRKPYSIRVTEFRGFGVRVAPCGRKRFFLHVQHEGTRVWRDCGDATAVPVADARARGDGSDGGDDATSVPFEVVAEEVFRRYGRRWKPRTFTVNQGYYRLQILPWFQGTPIAAITDRDVQAWFASLRAKPTARCRFCR